MCIFEGLFHFHSCLLVYTSLNLRFCQKKGRKQFTFNVLLVKPVVGTKNIKQELASWLFVYYTIL